jgi:hypothetical protein
MLLLLLNDLGTAASAKPWSSKLLPLNPNASGLPLHLSVNPGNLLNPWMHGTRLSKSL